MSAVDKPWSFFGEGVVGFVKRPGRRERPSLPQGLRRFPGPQVFLAERFDDSPVGPYVSLTILEPVVKDMRIGLHATLLAVNNDAARRVMRSRWDVPAEVGRLSWFSDAETRGLEWSDLDFRLTALVGRKRPWPFTKRVRMFQQSGDDLVWFPTKLRATIHSAQLIVEAPSDSRLGYAGGFHRGLVLSGMKMQMGAAHSNLRRDPALDRRRATEPGLLGMRDVGIRETTSAE